MAKIKSRIEEIFQNAADIFSHKMSKYGPAWLGFSYMGFADQIYIKAHRYKTLIITRERKISDPPELELYAIINYCVLFLISKNKKTLIQIFESPTAMFESPSAAVQKRLLKRYKVELGKSIALHKKKDHDYGSAWQKLSAEGLADIIFAKVLRLKVMLFKKRKDDSEDPEGVEATLRDLINYAAFALMLKKERRIS